MQSKTDDAASRGESRPLSEGLGPPAQPLRYYCNKCGHMGEQGPEHDVCAGYPQQRCQYNAVAWGPYWSTEQLAAAVAAERERLALLAESRTDGWHSLTADEIRRGAL